MRRIVYAGGTFYTTEQIASALLDYAGALAKAGTAATIAVPGLTDDGLESDIEVLVGPASQLMNEAAPDGVKELDERPETVERLRGLTLELAPPSPTFEPPFQDGDDDWDPELDR
jgi:hypothetical protein